VWATGDHEVMAIHEKDGTLLGRAVWKDTRVSGEPLGPDVQGGYVALAWMGSLGIVPVDEIIRRREKSWKK